MEAITNVFHEEDFLGHLFEQLFVGDLGVLPLVDEVVDEGVEVLFFHGEGVFPEL